MTTIDLHSHSTRSDGKETPTEVFEKAARAGVDILALTDHDTSSGWSEALEAAVRVGVGFIPGIEVTTLATHSRGNRSWSFSVHMLAYLPDANNADLAAELYKTVNAREIRAKKIVDRLAEDFPITWDLVLAELEDGATIARPAIADALVSLGVVFDRAEAFDGPLSSEGKYYVPNENVDTMDAIRKIRLAGGVPVIAHPMARSEEVPEGRKMPEEHFEEMVSAGLGGIEIFHRDVPEFVRPWLSSFAAKHDLVITGASDYHGENGKPNRLGENGTSLEMLQRIIDQATGVEPHL